MDNPAQGMCSRMAEEDTAKCFRWRKPRQQPPKGLVLMGPVLPLLTCCRNSSPGIKPRREAAKPLCSLWFGLLPTLPFKQEILKAKGVLCEAPCRLCLLSFSHTQHQVSWHCWKLTRQTDGAYRKYLSNFSTLIIFPSSFFVLYVLDCCYSTLR